MKTQPKDVRDPEAEEDMAEQVAGLNAYMCGEIIKVDIDNDPGIIVFYKDGRVLRLVANSNFAMAVPFTTGVVH